MPDDVAHYPRYRFPPAIISHAVWLYYRFTLSFRDVEDLLAQRGITVSYESIRHWCETFGAGLRATAPASGGASRRHVASGRTLRDDPRPASVPLAGRRPRWRGHRHPAPAPPGSPRRRAVLSQVAQAERPCAAPPRHRSPRELPRRAPGHHAVRRPRHHAATPTTGPKSPTSRRASASATCGASNRWHRPSGSSRSTTSFATCSPLDDIGFAPAISDFCARARSSTWNAVAAA